MNHSHCRWIFLYLAAVMLPAYVTQAQDRGQARSMVISRYGIVAAESPLAAQAGVRMLERGGNAVDAAIATNAVMGVVAPMSNGVGGDLFAIVYDAKANRLYGLNASGWAPRELTIDFLHRQGLRAMPQHGRDAFYKGEIAKKILEAMKHHNGTMTAQDLSEYSAEWVEPLSTTYHDWTVYELPPNGQGIAALEMLNILENFPLGEKDFGFGSTKALHAMIEAKKLAYADLAQYVGEPRGQKLPVVALLSKEYAKRRAQKIDPDRANCEAAAGELPAGGDTIYLSVVDREGNMVSLIQSNYESFGSGIVAPGTGFVLHDRGGLFSLDPSSPNALAGRKRPLHTIIPAFLQKDQVRVAFGIMGGG